MGSAIGMAWRSGLLMTLALVIGSGPLRADVTTERGSSILIFPKVIYDSQGLIGDKVDTVIQISNLSNSLVFARCFYVNSAPVNPSLPPSPTNPPQWLETDFEIFLTKQQPTYWLVSQGRRVDPSDRSCSRTFADCFNAGFDPGYNSMIPPTSGDPFVGELKCVEVDSAGAPINGNHLKGEATIVNLPPAVGDASKYNAIGVVGLNTDLNSNNSDNTLCLGGGPTATCPTGAEYNGCPGTVILNHYAEGATNPAIDLLGNGPSQVATELTLLPCTQDFENQAPKPVTVQFRLYNEFEQQLSASTTVTCWGNFKLSEIGPVFRIGFLGTRFAQTRMSSPFEQGGFVAVSEEFHQQGGASPIVSRVAFNLHGEGERQSGDVVLLPEIH